MTRDDAVTIVSMIVSHWPGQTWDDAELAAYVSAIESWDAEVTTRAVARAVNHLRFRPKVAELREFVQIERRSALSPREEADLVRPEKPMRPLWVERWERARKADDERLFPEQLSGIETLCRASPENFKAYRPPDVPMNDASVWVQPDEYLREDDAIVTA